MEKTIHRQDGIWDIDFWRNCLTMFNENTPEETVLVYKLHGEKILMVRKKKDIELVWFDSESNRIRSFHESEFYVLEELIMKKQQSDMTLAEKADLLLTMICMKNKKLYLSDLKFLNDENKSWEFENCKRDKKVYVYVKYYIGKCIGRTSK